MNARFTITALFIMTFSMAFSQNLFVGSYVEKTQVSPKLGTTIGYQFSTGHIVAGFYQEEADMLHDSENEKPRFYEKEFYGVSFSAPLVNTKKLDVLFNVRMGASNKINFAITPSLMADYKVFKVIHLNAGVGMRALKATVQGGVRIDLF